jgi:hypothetical protein
LKNNVTQEELPVSLENTPALYSAEKKHDWSAKKTIF